VYNNLEQCILSFLFLKKKLINGRFAQENLNYTLTVDDLKIILTVILIDYLGKSEKNVICIIIMNAVCVAERTV
jgi:hypothetical protein